MDLIILKNEIDKIENNLIINGRTTFYLNKNREILKQLNDRYNNCFKNIQKFFVSVEKDIENVGEWDRVKLELNSDKKDLIDGLYRAAEVSWEETLLKYMQDKGIMSKHFTLYNKKVK